MSLLCVPPCNKDSYTERREAIAEGNAQRYAEKLLFESPEKILK